MRSARNAGCAGVRWRVVLAEAAMLATMLGAMLAAWMAH